MFHKMGYITLLVNDYDEALFFYKEKMSFELEQDVSFGKDKRWISLKPPHQKNVGIVFVKADTTAKKERVGNQAANHVFITLESHDCRKDFELMKAKGVHFFGEPEKMPWGVEVVFEDLYGNRFDLIQPTEMPNH